MTRFQTMIIAIALSCPAIAIASEPTKLTLSHSGIETRTGAVMVILFDSEDAYNGKGAPVRATKIPAAASDVTMLIEGLPAGRYAIKSFHDIDGDGKMSTNPFGIPVEPFAFSNNAKGEMGPASWADAAFEIKPGANTHSISIK